jgi:hypothetical protein
MRKNVRNFGGHIAPETRACYQQTSDTPCGLLGMNKQDACITTAVSITEGTDVKCAVSSLQTNVCYGAVNSTATVICCSLQTRWSKLQLLIFGLCNDAGSNGMFCEVED